MGEFLFCPICVGEYPVDFVGEGAVEDAGVVCRDGEVDVGFEEGVNGVMGWIWYAADAQVGGGAGFDDGAKLGETVEHVLLALGYFFKALGSVRAFDTFVW